MTINYRDSVLGGVIKRCLMIAVLISSSCECAIAAEVRHLEVHHKGGVYSMSVEAYLNAPISDVYAVLTDYDNFERVADAIIESDIVGNPEPGVYLVHTGLKACVFYFCLEKQKTERIELRSGIEAVAIILPEQSDFRFGTTHWTLSPEGEGTRIRLDVSIEPNFWIPPLIGPPVFKTILQKESTQSTQYVEQLARENSN
jgi:hypothetical protein